MDGWFYVVQKKKCIQCLPAIALYYGGHHNQMTGQGMILRPIDATQDIAGLLKEQNSSLSSSMVTTQVQ
jgi:hypothetical protein